MPTQEVYTVLDEMDRLLEDTVAAVWHLRIISDLVNFTVAASGCQLAIGDVGPLISHHVEHVLGRLDAVQTVFNTLREAGNVAS